MRKSFSGFIFLVLLPLAACLSCCTRERYYSEGDFALVPKTDAHFHYLTTDESYIKFAESLNFRIVTPIWEGDIPIDTQLAIAALIKEKHPGTYSFLTSFHTENILSEGFTQSAVRYIEEALAKGASGVKIWKNIGMVLRKPDSTFIMADDSLLSGLFSYLENNSIPVTGHLGEPRNCWLPLEEMTDRGDAAYYSENPQYHMFLHPEYPSYGEQVEAVEDLLSAHPRLDYTGAHLASLEWSIDELAKRFAMYGNLKADLAARISHLQLQSAKDYEKVRNFMILYQDRLIYGTDNEVHDKPGVPAAEICSNLEKGWYRHWIYFATDSVVNGVKGLKLPAAVIDKLYFTNASRFFK